MENVKILAFVGRRDHSFILIWNKKQAEFSVWEKHPVSGLSVLFYGKLMRRVSQFRTVKLLFSSSSVEVFHFTDVPFEIS